MQRTQQSRLDAGAVEGIVNKCNASLNQYLSSKLMRMTSEEPVFGTKGFNLATTCRAAHKLSQEHDLGIGLAFGGVPLAFIMEKHGLPVMLVRSKRKGFGVSWNPIDELKEDMIRDRRILVTEIDVLLGRTLSRTLQELDKHKPKSINLLLEKSHTFIPVPYYKKLLERRGKWLTLPPLMQAFEETARVIMRRYGSVKLVTFEDEKIVLEYGNGQRKFGDVLFVDLKPNVPKGFGKIFTLDDDFTFYVDTKSIREPLDGTEKKILAGNGDDTGPTDKGVGDLVWHYLNDLDLKLRT